MTTRRHRARAHALKGLRPLLGAARRPLGWLARQEAVVLVTAFFIVLAVYGFIELATEIREGEMRDFDEWFLRLLRRDIDPAMPIGPAWLPPMMMDITALGGVTILALVTLVAAGYLRPDASLRRHRAGHRCVPGRRPPERSVEAGVRPRQASRRAAPDRGREPQLPQRALHGRRRHLPHAGRSAGALRGPPADPDLRPRCLVRPDRSSSGSRACISASTTRPTSWRGGPRGSPGRSSAGSSPGTSSTAARWSSRGNRAPAERPGRARESPLSRASARGAAPRRARCASPRCRAPAPAGAARRR